MTEQSTREYDSDQKITEIADTQDQAQNDQNNSRSRIVIANESSNIFQLFMIEHEICLKTKNALFREQIKFTDLKRANVEKKIQIAKFETIVANVAMTLSANKFKFVKSNKIRFYYNQNKNKY